MKSFAKLGVMVVLAMGCALSGCVSIVPPKPTIDYQSTFDFSTIAAIAFTQQQSDVGDDDLNEMLAQHIRASLGNSLEDKGLRVVEDPSQAQLLLRWQLVAEEKTDVEVSRSNSYYMCWRCGSSITDIRVKEYTRGTFVVEFVDPASNLSVWRGVMRGRLSPERSLKDQQALINAACTEILSNFPPRLKLL